MKESILREKALTFSSNIVLFYENFLLGKNDNTIAKQLLRSATSIGANLSEANYANSKADFVYKLHIALKECGESLYWLELLKRIKEYVSVIEELEKSANEIKAMIIKSIKTAKTNNEEVLQ